MSDLPLVIGPSGLVPQTPNSVLAQLLAAVAAVNPGYTANLPGSLVEDISSTDVAAILQCDSALVDLVNSLTPLSANAWLLTQQGNLVGVPQGQASNTSVFVVFSGPVGYVIPQDFAVSDGTYQYLVKTGGIIGSGGTSLPLYALATTTGTWAVPASSVNQVATSVPIGVSLSVNNPNTGTPGSTGETEASYRGAVTQAWLAASQGMARYLRTLLRNVPGVQPRLVAPVQIGGGGWEIIVGGGDPYQVAYAIWQSLFDVSSLVGSALLVSGITQANPGVVTTTLNHGYQTGQVVNIAGVVGMTSVNNTPLTATVLTEKTFGIGVNTTGYGTYVSGGVVTPNFRNQTPAIVDYPDTYVIPYVDPPEQSVAIAVTWNTSSINFVSDTAVAQLGTPALIDYVNSVYVGQPMNLFEMQDAFKVSLAALIPGPQLTRMIFAVSINGVGVSPSSGTGILAGDPESYFLTNSSLITIARG